MFTPYCMYFVWKWSWKWWNLCIVVNRKLIAVYQWAFWGWSWSFGSWMYSYLFNQCISPQRLWIRIPTTLCGKVLSMVFSGYSGFLHQLNWPPRYSWNIIGSGIKHHRHNPNLIIKWISYFVTTQILYFFSILFF